MSYTPASILTSGSLPNLVAVFYERQAIPNFKAETPFLSMTKQKPLPMKSGNQIQFYTYSLLSANTNQAAEGTVGSPITESSTSITATIGQYADFINTSDLAMDVAIDDPSLLQNLATELNYRLALTLNSLVQITADTANGVDGTVNIELANGTFLSANNIRTGVSQLQSVNTRPLTKDGHYGGIMHPLVERDVLNDTSVNGLTDILKRDSAGIKKLLAPPSIDDAVEYAGVRFKKTSTAPSGTVSGVTKYNTYIFADNALFSIFLGKSEGGDKNYRLNIQEAPKNGSVSDPAGQIGGYLKAA